MVPEALQNPSRLAAVALLALALAACSGISESGREGAGGEGPGEHAGAASMVRAGNPAREERAARVERSLRLSTPDPRPTMKRAPAPASFCATTRPPRPSRAR